MSCQRNKMSSAQNMLSRTKRLTLFAYTYHQTGPSCQMGNLQAAPFEQIECMTVQAYMLAQA